MLARIRILGVNVPLATCGNDRLIETTWETQTNTELQVTNWSSDIATPVAAIYPVNRKAMVRFLLERSAVVKILVQSSVREEYDIQHKGGEVAGEFAPASNKHHCIRRITHVSCERHLQSSRVFQDL